MRPITGLRNESPAIDEGNDILVSKYVWTSTNLSAAILDVMTPCALG